MKKLSPKASLSRTSAEYDFSSGVRGRYARSYAAGSNVVLLEPDVARAFPTAKAVNRSLRGLIGVTHLQRPLAAKAR